MDEAYGGIAWTIDIIMQVAIIAVTMAWLWMQAVIGPAQVDHERPTDDGTGNPQKRKRKDSI